MTKKRDSLWLDRCAFELPYCYRLCVTENDFHKELKRLNIPKKSWPLFLKTAQANATCHFFQSAGDQLAAIVCMSKKDCNDRPLDQILGLLVHESMHIWRECREHVGETDPSFEFEAYAVQRIAQNLVWSWLEQTK